MKTQSKPQEFPVIPPTPEIKPGKNIPDPGIQPEHPIKIIPIEKPEKKNPPEIKPGKD